MSRYKPAAEFLLKADFELGGGFQSFAGLQTRNLQFDDTTVDVTNADSEGNWTETVGGIKPKKLTFGGDGIFVSGPFAVQFQQAMLDGRLLLMQIIIPGLGTWEGRFSIGRFELTGGQSDVTKFRSEFASSGPIAFTPNTSV